MGLVAASAVRREERCLGRIHECSVSPETRYQTDRHVAGAVARIAFDRPVDDYVRVTGQLCTQPTSLTAALAQGCSDKDRYRPEHQCTESATPSQRAEV
jgi:hypothetical protein